MDGFEPGAAGPMPDPDPTIADGKTDKEEKGKTRPGLETTSRQWLARAGTMILAIVLLRLGFELWWVGRIHEHVWMQVGVALLYIAGTGFLFISMVDIPHYKLDRLGFLVLSAALAFYAVASIRVFALHYTSDALLFVHEAARLLLAGQNPYQAVLVGGYEAFDVPYYVQTPTTSGGKVTNLNYPALSFLIYTPFVASGLEDMRPVSASFLLGVMGLVFLRTPRHLRLLALSILFLSTFFLSFALSGFDIVYIFFLVAAVVLWKRNRMAAMVAFGLACAVKQQPWFVAPFLLIRLWKESEPLAEKRERLIWMGRYVSVAAAVFILPNALFIIWDVGAWFLGILTPVGGTGESLVPLAQGVLVFFYTGTVYIDPFLLMMLALSAFVALLVLYWTYYERMIEALWVAPALILLFNQRALQNYYEMFYPIGLASVLATIPEEWEDFPMESPISSPQADQADDEPVDDRGGTLEREVAA